MQCIVLESTSFANPVILAVLQDSYFDFQNSDADKYGTTYKVLF